MTKKELIDSRKHHDEYLYVNVMQKCINAFGCKVQDSSKTAGKVVSGRVFDENANSYIDLSMYNNIVENNIMYIVSGSNKMSEDDVIKLANDAVNEKHTFFNKQVNKKKVK